MTEKKTKMKHEHKDLDGYESKTLDNLDRAVSDMKLMLDLKRIRKNG